MFQLCGFLSLGVLCFGIKYVFCEARAGIYIPYQTEKKGFSFLQESLVSPQYYSFRPKFLGSWQDEQAYFFSSPTHSSQLKQLFPKEQSVYSMKV